jgi:hypothetical protein
MRCKNFKSQYWIERKEGDLMNQLMELATTESGKTSIPNKKVGCKASEEWILFGQIRK